MGNLVTGWLEKNGYVADDFEGWCAIVAARASEWLRASGVPCRRLWVEPTNYLEHLRPATLKRRWYYHVVVESAGVIHDPWYGPAAPLDEYLKDMFPNQEVNVTVDADHLYEQERAEDGFRADVHFFKKDRLVPATIEAQRLEK
jgi:hypothetical protein